MSSHSIVCQLGLFGRGLGRILHWLGLHGCIHRVASTLFVTTASTETLNGTILGVTCFSPLPVRPCERGTILILRGEIPRPIGNLPESLSQAMLGGTMLVGRLGVISLHEQSRNPHIWPAPAPGAIERSRFASCGAAVRRSRSLPPLGATQRVVPPKHMLQSRGMHNRETVASTSRLAMQPSLYRAYRAYHIIVACVWAALLV